MEKMTKSKEQWRKELDPETFAVTREGATEPPFSGRYYTEKADGWYHCACCDLPLFQADAKYDSGSGWPSFDRPADNANVATREDLTHGMRRVEIRCARCDAHLGHLFPDGPPSTGMRYCVNSLALDFKPAGAPADDRTDT